MKRRRVIGHELPESAEMVAHKLKARRAGYMASAEGAEEGANPWPFFTALGAAWADGWRAHQREEPFPGELPAEPPRGAPPPEPPPPEEPPPPPPEEPPPPPVQEVEERPTVRVPPPEAPFPWCPGCGTRGGEVCGIPCPHRQDRELAAAERLHEGEPPELEAPAPPGAIALPYAPAPPLRLRVVEGEVAPVPEVVELLRAALRDAEAGRVRGVLLVTDRGDSVGTAYHIAHRFQMLGGLEVLRARIAFALAREP